MLAMLLVAFVVVPMVATPYAFSAILIPFLIFALATLGLNILTGYAGQLSLGTAAFMALAPLPATTSCCALEGINPGRLHSRWCLRGDGRHRVRAAEPAHPRVSPRHRRLRHSFCGVVPDQGAMVYQQQFVRRDHRAADRDSRFQV